jgi:sigma-B regulation protein RsbU (phosphoserine phosphatase)
MQLDAGDALFAYSDGLTEAMNAGQEQWGEQRLHALLAAGEKLDGRAVLASLLGAVREFTGDQPQTDDIAALLLRWKP